MPNQPDKTKPAIYLRITQETKKAIQDDVDRLNTDNPGAGYTISSWIRGAIDARLDNVNKKINKKASK